MKRVLLLLAEDFDADELAAFTDALGFATAFGDGEIEVVAIGLRPDIRRTLGLQFEQGPLTAARNEFFDVVVAVPGQLPRAGFRNDACSDEFVDVFCRFAAAGEPITAVCTGAMPVARNGVLRGRRAATCHLLEGSQRRELAVMGAQVIDEPTVQDGSTFTSTSPATAIEVASSLLKMLTSPENVAATSRMMTFA